MSLVLFPFPFFPIPPTAQIFTLFGQLDSTHSNPHGGVDFGVVVGTPVFAPDAGFVSRIFNDSGGGGNVLELTHGSLKTVYMHLTGYNVGVGDQVAAGDLVAFSGGAKGAPGAGDSQGPHLHFEVRDLANNKSNPLDYLPSNTWRLSPNMVKLLGKDTIDGGPLPLLPIMLGGVGAFLFWKILSR